MHLSFSLCLQNIHFCPGFCVQVSEEWFSGSGSDSESGSGQVQWAEKTVFPPMPFKMFIYCFPAIA